MEVSPLLYPLQTALLLLHYQNEVVDPDGAIGRTGLAGAASGPMLAAADVGNRARASGALVVHVTFAAQDHWCASSARNLRKGAKGAFAAGSWGVQPTAQLLQGEDSVLTHDTMSAFAGTALSSLLQSEGRNRVLLAGVSTHLVVAATAFAATDLGLDTVVISGACAAPTEVAHRAALGQLSAICHVT